MVGTWYSGLVIFGHGGRGCLQFVSTHTQRRNKRREIDLGNSLYFSPLFFFLSYLVIGSKAGCERNPQSSKDQVQKSVKNIINHYRDANAFISK